MNLGLGRSANPLYMCAIGQAGICDHFFYDFQQFVMNLIDFHQEHNRDAMISNKSLEMAFQTVHLSKSNWNGASFPYAAINFYPFIDTYSHKKIRKTSVFKILIVHLCTIK